ncbi:MAG: M50 family metallopeptidase [Firmicutes bacterium]|nr:M50 family metallopeptidase [Bacillota bacterium]
MAFAIVGGFWPFAAALLFAVIVHEVSHIIAARAYGIRAGGMRILPFGAAVTIDADFLPPRDRVMILLAGSLGNAVVGLLISGMLWLAPAAFMLWEVMITAMAVPAILNLLPIYPLDGGKIITTLLGPKSVRPMLWMSTAFFAVLLVIGVVLVNFPLVIVSVMLLTCAHTESSIKFTSLFRKKRPGAVWEVAVSGEMTLLDIYKRVHPHRHTKFVVTDRGHQSFYENTLEQWITEKTCLAQLDDFLQQGRIRE